MLTNKEACELLIAAVESNGGTASIGEVTSVFGGDPATQLLSAKNVANECRAAGLLALTADYQDMTVTPAGRRFIGKDAPEQGDDGLGRFSHCAGPNPRVG